ncbi:MAG: hypothetical protein JNK15_25935 [Planctomycetes bacterium]|nr:hypothetical protein [Planctomycetota bacterium]
MPVAVGAAVRLVLPPFGQQLLALAGELTPTPANGLFALSDAFDFRQP